MRAGALRLRDADRHKSLDLATGARGKWQVAERVRVCVVARVE